MSRQILVIGNHRTGSSCVAGILHKIGVPMGDVMLGAHPSNPSGHFEDMEFLLYNDSLVGSWLTPIILEGEDLRVPRIRYSRMISARDKKKEIWGVKDPRLCIVAGYFLDLLYDPRIVSPYRNSEVMVQSLMRRNHVVEEEAYRILGLYDMEMGLTLVQADELGIPVHYVQYESLVEDPADCIDKLAEFVFDGVVSSYNHITRDRVVNFVDPKLNHAEDK